MSLTRLFVTILTALAVALSGCGHDDHDHKPGDKHDHKNGDKKDDHKHDHKNGDKKDDHGHDGPKHDLGSVEAGGVTIAVTQVGSIAAGHTEGIVELDVKGADKLKALRVWVGAENTTGVKSSVSGVKEGDNDVHIELPKEIPAGSALWLEMEIGGDTHRKSLAIK